MSKAKAGMPNDERTTVMRVAAAAWPYALLVFLGLFILLPKLGDYGFWDPWEPKYGVTVREMLERDSYVVPYYRNEVRLYRGASGTLHLYPECGIQSSRVLVVLCMIPFLSALVHYLPGAAPPPRPSLLPLPMFGRENPTRSYLEK